MRIKHKFGLAAAGLALAARVFYAAPFQPALRPPASLMPSGALLYLEAKDFAGELHAWQGSSTRQRWLLSARDEAFARSHLYLRLAAAWESFGTAAGFAPNSAVLESIAGKESGLALYDIGNLEFLYVTHLSSARAMQTVLGQARGAYQTRHAGQYDFYVRTGGGRTVAFAMAEDHLLLGTREELVASALRLLSGEKLATIQSEGWYTETTGTARTPGDLRLVMNLEPIVQSPHFRSYWIQRNSSEVKNYWAGIVDMRRTQGEIGEERLFLRKNPVPAAGTAVPGLTRLVPDGAVFYQAWAQPEPVSVVSLIESKLLVPKQSAQRSSDFAPVVQTGAPPVGSEADLETRIDQPPLSVQRAVALDALRAVVGAAGVRAALQIQSARVLRDGTFVDTPSLVAIEAGADWDIARVRSALTAAAASIWTTREIGAGWVDRQRGPRAWLELDGLGRLAFAIDGKLLLLANSADLLGQAMDRIDRTPERGDESYTAGFRHAAARPDYKKMMAALDDARPAPAAVSEEGGTRRRFFSEDLASLSDTLAQVREVTIRVHDSGAELRESVMYRLE